MVSDAPGGQVADGSATATITVTVRNAAGNPLSGQAVVLEVSGSGNTITQPDGRTGADGIATATVATTEAGTRQVTVVIEPGANELRIVDALSIVFTADPESISASLSTIVAAPATGIVADGVTLTMLTVTVRDAHGNLVPGQSVQLSSNGSGDVFAQPVAVTDAAGVATGTLTSTTAETKTVTATINPGADGVTLASGANVTFVADDTTIDANLSTAVADPATGIAADGTAVSTVTVTVRDAQGNPVAGQLVSLAATGTNNTLVQPAVATDSSGQASGTLATTDAEIKIVTATINPGAGEVVLVQTPTVEFLGDPDDVSSVLSSVVAVPEADVVADGSTLSTVTVTVRDGNGNTVQDQVVELASTGTGNTITQPPGHTDASGVAVATIASTVAESKTLTATVNPGVSAVVLATTPVIDFIGDSATIDADLSTVVANPTTVISNGADTSMITITVRDANDNPVAGQTVQLAATGSGNTLTQPAAVTDGSGVATGSIASTVAGTKVVTATVNPGASEVVVVQTASVTCTPDSGSISASLSTATANPTTGLIADGTDSSTVTVTVLDDNGNPVPAQVVQITATGGGNTITPPTSVTDGSGVAIGSVASTSAEVKTLTITVNPGAGQVVLDDQPTVEFIADASNISAIHSSAVAVPSLDVVADGSTVSTITTTLRDVHGNVIPGLAAQFAATGSDNTLTQPPGLTDAGGQISGTIASTRAGVKVITVTADPSGSSVVLLQTPTVEFIGDPATISATGSFASANPTTGVYANGIDSTSINVIVRDVNGNAVKGQTVFLAATGSNNSFTQPPTVTDDNGSASGTLVSTTSEVKTITVTVNPGPTPVELVQKPTVEFIADTTISPALSTVTAIPATNVVADGSDSSTITVTVRDGLNSLVSGATVVISATGTGNTITQPVGTTNGAGQATGSLASVVAETKTITITVNPGPEEVVIDTTPTVEFVADASNINDTLSTAVANPATGLVADGTATSTITITVLDDNGNPVPDQAVSLASTGTGNTLTQPAGLTDAAGVTTGTIATTVSETKTITVTVNPGGGEVVLVSQPTVECIPDAIDSGLSSVVTVPSTNVVADGTTISTITVTVLDTLGNPVAGQTVELAATGSNHTLTQPATVTDASGITTGTIASTLAETKTITATVNPGAGEVELDDNPTVEFIADDSTISTGLSSVVAVPATGVVADDADSSTITITIRDANGNPVPGQSVTLASTGSDHTLTQPSGTSDASGQITGSIVSTKAEIKTITATINPGPGEVVPDDTPTIEFIADPSTIDAGLSSAVAVPNTNVVADDVELSTITVTVRDAQGNPVPGQSVQLASTGTGNTVTQPGGSTDASGQVTATIASTVAELKTLTVTANPGASQVVLTQQPTVDFIADASNINATSSTVVTVPSSDVVADGVESSTITITVVDTFGNPVPDQTVQLAVTGTGNTLTQPAAITDAAGQATGSIVSTVAEDKVVTATVNPGPGEVVLSATPTIGFIADVGAISDTLSSAVAAPSTGVVADGSTTSTITVTVLDEFGNPVPGQTVELAASGTGHTITQPVGTTDGSGQATGTIASTVAEVQVITVTINPGASEVVLIQTPSIEFIGDASNLSAALSHAFAVPSMNVAADGSTASVVYTHLRDVNDNPVAGVTIELAATGTGNTLTQPGSVTDGNGLASGSIASTDAEVKTLTITADPSGAAVAFDQQPTVEFVADASDISAALSSAVASPTTDVLADGTEISVITVTVRDGNGNPLPGQGVEIASTGSGNTLTQPAVVTDGNGEVVGRIASTVAETKTITATVNPGASEVVVTQQPTVVFIADAGNLSTSLSRVTVDTATGLAADGTAIATITVTVLDALGNPVPDRTVQLAATGTGNTLTQPAAVTDASGIATGTLASSTAEPKTITATVDPAGAAVVLDDTPTVEFAWVLGDTYYVRATGTDPGGCTGGTSPATAWATLAQAAGCVIAGDTVYVGAGTYVGSVELTASGTAADPIRFIADTEGLFTGDAGPVILDGAVANETIHLNGADWNEIIGLTVLGASGAGPPCGGILVEGENAVIRDNIVYGNQGGIYVNGVDSVAVESNQVSGNAGASSDGIVISDADDAVVRNNLVYDNGRNGVLVDTGSSNALVENNTVYANGLDGIRFDAGGETATVRNNIAADNVVDGIQQIAGTVISSYNDSFGNGGDDFSGVTPGTGDISSDPLFVDPDGADNQLGGAQGTDDSFHLDFASLSPAIDAGSTNATMIALEDGTTLADRTTRTDEVLDGTSTDGATVNLGFHHPVSGDPLSPLENGDVRLVCGAGASRQLLLRDWDVSGQNWTAALTAPPTGGTVLWTVSGVSPLTNGEELIAVLSDDGSATDLRLLRWSGDSWLTDWSSTAIGTGDAHRRGFDLAYEAGGDALVVYSDGTDTPVYRVLSKGNWSDVTSLPLNDGGGPNPDTNSGVVTWIELIAQPGTDEIALVFSDDGDDLVAIVWDGDQWLTVGASTLETALEPNGGSGEPENRSFDAAYEETTGDLMVAWGQASTDGFWWSLQADGSTSWSVAARVSAAPAAGRPHYVDLASEPGGERIAAGSFDLGDGAERLGLATWDGDSWVHAVELDSQIRNSNDTATGDFQGAVGWVGSTGQAICVYSDDQTGTIDWASWSGSVGWEQRGDITISGKGATDSVVLVQYEGRSLLLALLSDSDGNLYAASYDGVNWTVMESGSAIVTGISGSDSVPFASGLLEN